MKTYGKRWPFIKSRYSNSSLSGGFHLLGEIPLDKCSLVMRFSALAVQLCGPDKQQPEGLAAFVRYHCLRTAPLGLFVETLFDLDKAVVLFGIGHQLAALVPIVPLHTGVQLRCEHSIWLGWQNLDLRPLGYKLCLRMKRICFWFFLAQWCPETYPFHPS